MIGGVKVVRRLRRSVLRHRSKSLLGVVVATVIVGSPGSRLSAFPVLDAGSGSSFCGTGVQTLLYRFSGTGWGPTGSADRTNFLNGVGRWDGYRNRAGTVFINSLENSLGIPVFRVTTPGAASSTTCSSGSPTQIVIGDTTNVSRTAAHEAGHAHGLSHSGNDDALVGTAGTASQPLMDGCYQSSGFPTTDDRLQYAHERDLQTFTNNVGFENGSTAWTGTFTISSGGPNAGGNYAKVQQGNSLVSGWARVTTPPNSFVVETDYKGGGSNKIKFEYRRVNYPTTGACNANSTPPFNPSTFDWDNTNIVGDTVIEIRTLPPSPSGWVLSHRWTPTGPPGGFSAWEAVDYRLQAYSETGGDLFIDDLELT